MGQDHSPKKVRVFDVPETEVDVAARQAFEILSARNLDTQSIVDVCGAWSIIRGSAIADGDVDRDLKSEPRLKTVVVDALLPSLSEEELRTCLAQMRDVFARFGVTQEEAMAFGESWALAVDYSIAKTGSLPRVTIDDIMRGSLN